MHIDTPKGEATSPLNPRKMTPSCNKTTSKPPPPRPCMPGRQQSMPAHALRKESDMFMPEHMRLHRQVSFRDTVEEYPTYEKYQGYFSEYDRRPVRRQRSMSDHQVKEIHDDLRQLREELFPEGDVNLPDPSLPPPLDVLNKEVPSAD